jgi:hypothetical protein
VFIRIWKNLNWLGRSPNLNSTIANRRHFLPQLIQGGELKCSIFPNLKKDNGLFFANGSILFCIFKSSFFVCLYVCLFVCLFLSPFTQCDFSGSELPLPQALSPIHRKSEWERVPSMRGSFGRERKRERERDGGKGCYFDLQSFYCFFKSTVS